MSQNFIVPLRPLYSAVFSSSRVGRRNPRLLHHASDTARLPCHRPIFSLSDAASGYLHPLVMVNVPSLQSWSENRPLALLAFECRDGNVIFIIFLWNRDVGTREAHPESAHLLVLLAFTDCAVFSFHCPANHPPGIRKAAVSCLNASVNRRRTPFHHRRSPSSAVKSHSKPGCGLMRISQCLSTEQESRRWVFRFVHILIPECSRNPYTLRRLS